MENTANVTIGESFSQTITIPITKAKKLPKIKMEHSHSIINLNVTQKREGEYFDQALYNKNVFDLVDIHPNLTYSTKTSKFINIFPNIEITISQITNHIKYVHSKNSHEHFTNDKFNHHVYKMQFNKTKQSIPIEYHIQPNKVEKHAKIYEHVHKSI